MSPTHSNARGCLVKDDFQHLRITTHAKEVDLLYCDNIAALAYSKDPK